MGQETSRVLIEDVAVGLGVRYVKVVNPFETEEAGRVVREALKKPGPSVVVFRAPCTLLTLRERRKTGAKAEPTRITEKCSNCMVCVKLTGCPALVPVDGKLTVDERLCTACTLCVSVCPYQAIRGGSL